MLSFLRHTACAEALLSLIPYVLQQAYEAAECFAQQTSIALSCALQCWRCCFVACVYASFHIMCMLGFVGHTACAVPGSLQQAYQTAECFAQQTSIALSCVLQCCRCCCVACVYAAFHMLCMLGILGHTTCAVPESLQQADEAAGCFAQQTSIALSCALQCWRCCCVACVYAALRMLCMLP